MHLPYPPFRFAGRSRGLRAVVVLPRANPATLLAAAGHPSIAPAPDGARLVAVDRGLRPCRSAGLTPDLWIGDGDSSRPPRGLEAIRLEPDKDASDFEVALRTLAGRDVRGVHVEGVWGGRPDHAWINLEVLGKYARAFPAGLSAAGDGVLWTFLSASGGASGVRLDVAPGRTFSCVALRERTRVSLRGARWPLRAERLARGSHGLSNETTARELVFEVHTGVAALMI